MPGRVVFVNISRISLCTTSRVRLALRVMGTASGILAWLLREHRWAYVMQGDADLARRALANGSAHAAPARTAPALRGLDRADTVLRSHPCPSGVRSIVARLLLALEGMLALSRGPLERRKVRK